MRATKLLPATLRRLVIEKYDSLVMFAENSAIRQWHFAKAKDVNLDTVHERELGYSLPDDTEAILQVHTRDNTGNTEVMVARRTVSLSTAFVPATLTKCSKKLLSLISSLEEREACPLRIVFGKRTNGKLYLIHSEPMDLSPQARLIVTHDLIGRVKDDRKRELLATMPADPTTIALKKFKAIGVAAIVKGTPVFPGLYVGTENVFAQITTTPAHVSQMQQASIIVTGGGTLSHAAIIAASEGIPCIVGVTESDIDLIQSRIENGQPLSFDAQRGLIYEGELEVEDQSAVYLKIIGEILFHARDYMAGDVLANADTPEAISAALDAGASGVGLLRTEHSYKESTVLVTSYLLAALKNDLDKRRQLLSELLDITCKMFCKVFEAAGDKYVCIRLLDAPLNEFNPSLDAEHNPMMGLRGCRFGIMYHDFYAMQVQAIVEAYRQTGTGEVGIMVPLVSDTGEIIILRDYIHRVWSACGGDLSTLKFGTMIETPRACMISGELAQFCDFLSFGTNDLTQFTYAMSRDDSHYLQPYSDLGALDCNPFLTLDARGVGRMIHFSVEQAKKMNPKIRIGAP